MVSNLKSLVSYEVRDCLHLREDIRGQLKDASSVTSKAYSTFRREVDPEMESMGSGVDGMEEVVEETQMSQAIIIMKPILRFLQLLCENHNRDLQVMRIIFTGPVLFSCGLFWL